MKILLVGDPHAKVTNLAETGRVMEWVHSVAREHAVHHVVLMGDLYDTHGIARIEVMKFWREQFSSPHARSIIALTGNHDMDHRCTDTWLSAHADQITVVPAEPTCSSPMLNSTQIGFVPYVADNDEFVRIVRYAAQFGIRTILCHQEFEGCQMDNGYYAPGGVKRDLLPAGMRFISGHIHKRQMLMFPEGLGEGIQVQYIGTPRHLTRSDIGEIKGVTVWDTDQDLFTFVPTPDSVAEPFRSFEITEETGIIEVPASERSYVDVRGTREFIKEVQKKLPKNAKVRTFPDAIKRSDAVKESDGISKAFMQYAREYCARSGMSQAEIVEVVKPVLDRCQILRG